MKIYFASDHAGFELKQELLNFVRGELGHEVEDCGATQFNEDDDYPEIIAQAAAKLGAAAKERATVRAILIGASGQGEAMVANRFKGVRCALYYGEAVRTQTDASGQELDMLTSTREHNDANALSLAARFLSVEEAKDAVRRWLATPFSGQERHVRRIAQMETLS
ncbi:MAG TPA: RpiB/LacA/LacB family sugar-phosphate isomerase [Candidatus Paceibacterota bacterium]|nr:RpiB/LacA/LacB family sugar-phosphate isomerase [Candidatus Paceibacterota bacterium]